MVATDVYGSVLVRAETDPLGDYKLTFPLCAGVYEDEFLVDIVPVEQQQVKLILSKEGYMMPEEIDETFWVGVYDRDFTLEKDTENNVVRGEVIVHLPYGFGYVSMGIAFAVVPTLTAISEDGTLYGPIDANPWDGSYEFRIPKQHNKVTLTARIPGASFIGLECEEKSKDVNIGSAPTPITKEVDFYLDCQCIPYTPPEVQEWMLNSPGNLHIYDSVGRHVGINTTTGCVDTEIPYVAYSGTEAYPQIAGIFNLSSDLKIIVEGTEAGSFDLIGKKRSDEKKKIEFRQVLSSASTRAELNIGPTSNYIMCIDTNNDGQVDYEKEPDLINKYPVASFTSPENTIVNQTITFDASQSYDLDGGIVEYEWYFGEGCKVEGETAMHNYLHPGRYPVMLTVMDDVGAIDISTKTITVSSKLNPNANFTIIPESSIVGQMITFNASNSTDPDGFIANYEWDFGDRSGRAGKVVTHSYSNPGSYSVTLTVEDDGGKIDTLTQVVEVTGEISSLDLPISSAEDSQLRPSIAYNSVNNEYLVTWDDKRGGSEREIYAQRLSGANNLVGSNFAIARSSGTDIDELNPFVVYNPMANEYLVVWNEKYGYHNLYYIYAQRVSNTGSLVGDKITVSSGGVRVRKLHPSVAYNPANSEYLVVWYGQDVEGQPYRIYGQRLSGSGSLLGSNFAVGEDIEKDNYQYYPQVVYNSHTNDYLVVWEDMRNGVEKDIYAQRVSGSGDLFGSNYCICNATNAQEAPSVAYNSADNQYLVMWQDGRTGSNADIYAQMISGTGNLLGNEIAVRVGRGTSRNPSVTYNSESNVYFVAWEDDDDIFAQVISNGSTLSESSIVICDAASNQGEPSVAYNLANNWYFITWHDYRNGNYDIYGAWVGHV